MHRSKHFLILGSILLAASLLLALTPAAAFAATTGAHSASRTSTMTHAAIPDACSSSCAINNCPPGEGVGDMNDWVKVIQFRLNSLDGAGLNVDGDFEQQTQAAVTTFQHNAGISGGGGAVGDRTWAAMGFCTGFLFSFGFSGTNSNTHCPPGQSDGGSNNMTFVEALQALLNVDYDAPNLTHNPHFVIFTNSPDNFHPFLAFDGIFGSNTKAAVTDFQDAQGISGGGGAVGNRTWSELGMCS